MRMCILQKISRRVQQGFANLPEGKNQAGGKTIWGISPNIGFLAGGPFSRKFQKGPARGGK